MQKLERPPEFTIPESQGRNAFLKSVFCVIKDQKVQKVAVVLIDSEDRVHSYQHGFDEDSDWYATAVCLADHAKLEA